MEFGEALRAARSFAKCSRADVARATGFGTEAVAKWENGLRRPFPDSVSDLVAGMQLLESDEGRRRAAMMYLSAGYVPPFGSVVWRDGEAA